MTAHSTSVIAGLDPAIHWAAKPTASVRMDARVKPGHDQVGSLNQFLKSLNRPDEGRVEVTETTLVFAAGAHR
jgi:hypothetical protein